jgi:predicted DNA-binding protein (MmcQ/YjbR family)
MAISGAQAQITTAVLGWEGTSAAPHRFGGVEYRLGKRELGHIHGDGMLDIPFPVKVRDEIVQAGQAQPHHLLAGSGWISFYLKETADIPRAIQLLRRSYDLAALQRQKRQASAS